MTLILHLHTLPSAAEPPMKIVSHPSKEVRMPDQPVELTPDRLRAYCDPASFQSDSTAEMEADAGIIGQPRAASAIEFAISVTAAGYNLYAAGEPGTGRNTAIRIAVEHAAKEKPIPNDWCYVHNFDQPDAPNALSLPAGMGCQLKNDMADLITELREEIRKAFEGKAYEERRAHLLKELQEKRDEHFGRFKKEAEERGFAVEQSGGGILTLPIRDGKPMSSQDWEELSDEDKEDLEKRQENLQVVMRDITRQVRELEKQAREKMGNLERIIANLPLSNAIDELREKYSEYKEVVEYLETVKEDILANLDDFKDEEEQQVPIPGLKMPRTSDPLHRYQINVIVDNCNTKGAPVVIETNPSFYNLVGRLEYRSTMGTMTTDFTMIKAGALHRANGGYLVIQALDLLRNNMSWDALKRAIRNCKISLEDMNEQYRLIQTQGLKPEPIPLDIKVVLVGSPLLGMLLYQYDEDFRKIFKVKADFGLLMDKDEEALQAYASFIATRASEEDLLPFDRTAMARVVEFGSRIVADQEKLSTQFIQIADLLRESDYWTRQEGSDTVTGEHVKKAIEEKIYRSNRIEERLRELIANGTLLVDTDGEVAGQINGLAVLSLGDYAFGKPSRLTARIFSGKAGIVQIDRDTQLAGNIHNKGVMILQGFFGHRYARKAPITLSASLTFEQLYDGVEGDSASSTELYCLLSALARVPLRQDLAVTGSVNQLGQIQAIGGVNEKIEGWFYTCKLLGFTGRQGVLIPQANVRNLMLKDEIVEAVEAGQFHIYPISYIDQGIELLTGRPAGEPEKDGSYPVGSINYRVQKHLESLSRGMREALGGNGGNNMPGSGI